MPVQYGKFEIPGRIKIDEKSASSTYAKFIAEPFERGFGHTVGSALRRMLLSSLEAPAIVAVSLEGVDHEYTGIEGIIEDMTNIVLNIKGALLRKHLDEEGSRGLRSLSSVFEVSQEKLDQNGGQVEITLADLIQDSEFEVVNKDLCVLTVTEPMKKRVDLTVAFGRGYVASERLEFDQPVANQIAIDACFSPVSLANYYVEDTRVGQDTDFDRLVLEISTDGRITPAEALAYAAQIGHKHFDVFTTVSEQTISFEEENGEVDGSNDELMEKLCLRIDEVELSVRSTNCLSGANISTIAELVSNTEKKLLEFRNFGRKSLNEIKTKLTDMGLHLGMDLSKLSITTENAREKVEQYLELRKSKKDTSGVEA